MVRAILSKESFLQVWLGVAFDIPAASRFLVVGCVNSFKLLRNHILNDHGVDNERRSSSNI